MECLLGQVEKLPPQDLLRSLEASSLAVRAKQAERLAALYCCGTLDVAERSLAEEAFRLLRYDSEIIVRRLLAECLKDAPLLPRDIALALATDKAEIAVPFIEDSPALGELDLLAILRDHPGPHRLAIARRRDLPKGVSDALCRCGDASAVAATLAD
jgi:uncharacterized protein (DUF2336 family)